MSTDNKSEPWLQAKQRVRMLPNKPHFPPTQASGGVRYGTILFANNHGGMFFVNEDRQSEVGEWAYCVAQSPNAGALWWSARHLQPLRGQWPKDKKP